MAGPKAELTKSEPFKEEIKQKEQWEGEVTG